MSSGSSTREINVTPLIDVLLVLLVIFIVLTPMVMKMESVDLPPWDDRGEPAIPLVVRLHADLTVSVDEAPPVMASDLAAQLRPKLGRGRVVFVDFDEGVAWTEAIATIDTVHGLADESNRIALRMRDEPHR